MKNFFKICAALTFASTIYIGLATLLHVVFGFDAMIRIGHGSSWIALPEDTIGLLAVFVMMLAVFLLFWGIAQWDVVKKWASSNKGASAIVGLLLLGALAIGVNFLQNVDNDDIFVMVQKENTAAIEKIIAKGGDINRVDSDRLNSTALHDAATWNSASMVKFLLDHGANPNAQDRYRRTPLMVALLYREGGEAEILPVVQDFIAAKTDVTVASNEGVTAYDIATEKNYLTIAGLLK